VPGIFPQTDAVFMGKYTYTVTPRYFKNNKLEPLDAALSVSVEIEVAPFVKKDLAVGFTRGFVQSQAFTDHFGNKALFKPANKELLFDTSKTAGKNKDGNYSFADEYKWCGFTAREKIFALLDEVVKNKNLMLDVFAYDLSEPDIMKAFLQLAKEGRIRIILDNATLHHSTANPQDEDLFESEFKKIAKSHAAIQRGKFLRFAHDKVMIVYDKQTPLKVLTGSTNFSITGLYVNANHILIFNSATVAAMYAAVFNESWNDKVSAKFKQSKWANKLQAFTANGIPKMNISFSPHDDPFALSNLTEIANRVSGKNSAVFFAVMALANATGPVLPALQNIHKSPDVFSYGISDEPGGIFLYKPNTPEGVLVTGKSAKTQLPPPFNKETNIGLTHQIHHKFIVCDFNGKNPVVWCGSSNLALGGEQENGDNLIAIYDADIATVFTIEAVALVDHFHFRNKFSGTPASPVPKPFTLKADASWVPRYFDKTDLYFRDRVLFG
jgi:PLD-like domain